MNTILDSLSRWLAQLGHGNEAKLVWTKCAPCPERRTEPAATKVGRRFFVIGGYEQIERVHNTIDVFDLSKSTWSDQIVLPEDVPQTHMGIALGQERFIYMIGGQIGPQCRPAVADCFAFDTQDESWNRLPSLPEPRYGPTVQLWNGRLHTVSGAQPDRWTSACDHWSIAVNDGKALEDRWREEAAIPRGGPHRASAVLNGKLYVFGGQDGDVKPIAGDPGYICDWKTPFEKQYGDSFVLSAGGEWRNVATMAVACTHAESLAFAGQCVLLVGGNQHRERLSDLVQMYDWQNDRWKIVGRLPYAMKTTAVYDDGWLYTFAGQRSRNKKDLSPGEVLDTVWRTKFDPETV